MGVEFVPLSIEAFRKTRMADFNVLILPDGSADAYAKAFDKDGVKKLKDWCTDGGTFICVGGGAGFAAGKKSDLTGARVVGAAMLAKQDDDSGDDDDKGKEKDKDEDSAAGKPSADKDHQPEGRKAKPVGGETEPDKKAETGAPDKPSEAKAAAAEPPAAAKKPADPAAHDLPVADAAPTRNGDFDRRKIPLAVPGAIFRATLNPDHFLTYGYDGRETLPVLVDTDQFLTLSKRGANVLTFPAAPAGNANPPSLRLAGFTWPDNTDKLIRGTAAMIEEPVGEGHVILTANGPSFRLLWHASTRLWLNGLLYAPAIQGSGD